MRKLMSVLLLTAAFAAPVSAQENPRDRGEGRMAAREQIERGPVAVVESRPELAERRADRGEVRENRQEVRQDRQEVRADRQEARGDRQEVRQDRRDGRVGEVRADRVEVRADRVEVRQDQRELNRDRGDLRGDRRDGRNDWQNDRRNDRGDWQNDRRNDRGDWRNDRRDNDHHDDRDWRGDRRDYGRQVFRWDSRRWGGYDDRGWRFGYSTPGWNSYWTPFGFGYGDSLTISWGLRWFDGDRDGRMSDWEWRRAQQAFYRFADRNRDGYVSQREYDWAVDAIRYGRYGYGY